MASIRTARVLATVAAVPLALGLLGGVAHADAFSYRYRGGDDNYGNRSATEQAASGIGNTNQSNTASVDGSRHTDLIQFTTENGYAVIFGNM
jgi:hypothetical protein